MLSFSLAFLSVWLILTLVTLFLSFREARIGSALVLVAAFFTGAFTGFGDMLPWQRLALMSVGLLFMLKFVYLLWRYQSATLLASSKLGLFVYLTLWPGFDLEPFLVRKHVEEDGHRFVRGFLFFFLGFFLLLAVSIFGFSLEPATRGILGILALISMLHLGYADMLSSLVRVIGFEVVPLFDSPYTSTSLRDFWSRRWNHAFVEMNRLLFAPMLKRFSSARVFLLFLLSGVLHELAISYPVANAYLGLPLAYFIIQGLGFIFEQRVLGSMISDTVKRVWLLSWILLPLPLLFTPAFQGAFIIPLLDQTSRFVLARDAHWWLSLALYCAAAGNFACIAAGSQVPFRLNWKEELPRLSNFNRKIFLNYYCYIGLAVFAWGVITIFLHDEILAGDKAALALTVLMAFFWGIRILVDFFFFDHKDWPPGPTMVIGHTFLTAVFFALSGTYFGVLVWHLF